MYKYTRRNNAYSANTAANEKETGGEKEKKKKKKEKKKREKKWLSLKLKAKPCIKPYSRIQSNLKHDGKTMKQNANKSNSQYRGIISLHRTTDTVEEEVKQSNDTYERLQQNGVNKIQ